MLHINFSSFSELRSWLTDVRPRKFWGAMVGKANTASNLRIRVRVLFPGVPITFNPVTSKSCSSTMIFPTAIILSLFLTSIARALPQGCQDSITPKLSTADAGHNSLYSESHRLTYDPKYDDGTRSTYTVSCSNGPNGLAYRYPTFGSFPTFPHIGGAFNVVFGSPYCGGCWQLTNPENGKSLRMAAIDHVDEGFNIATSAFKELGGDIQKGTLQVDSVLLPPNACGIFY